LSAVTAKLKTSYHYVKGKSFDNRYQRYKTFFLRC
jgi:hypothetical protein